MLKKAKFSLFNKLSAIYKGVDPDSVEGKYIADMRKAVKPIRDAFMEGAAQASKNVEAKKKASANTTEAKSEKKTVKSQARGADSVIKSADPVTYDDNGDVIPLSERFNEKSKDIRYKTRATAKDSLGNELTTEQQEFFKDSVVRDKSGNLKVVYHGTTADFKTFKKGDVGFHFGTKGAARGRVGYGSNVNLKEVYLNITNPIVFDEDLGSWDADFRLTRELYERGILTW